MKHKVECREGNGRVSMATFVLGPKDKEIEAPEELVDDEHPRLYVPFTYHNYRNLRLTTPLWTDQTLAAFQTPPTPTTPHHSSSKHAR